MDTRALMAMLVSGWQIASWSGCDDTLGGPQGDECAVNMNGSENMAAILHP